MCRTLSTDIANDSSVSRVQLCHDVLVGTGPTFGNVALLPDLSYTIGKAETVMCYHLAAMTPVSSNTTVTNTMRLLLIS